jgi:tripartite-type tricarboxylate transporter receptor subunit TctC
MPEVKIERLALKLQSGDEKSARRLAEQVGAALERAPIAADLPQRTELVRMWIGMAPGASADQVARQIVSELMRELRRS